MIVYLYKFGKRPNSTKTPLPSEGKSFTVQLKEPTSFENPVLRFEPSGLTTGLFSPNAYNYASILYWQRYYFIDDWEYINGAWEASLSVDVLGSFKGEIGNTNAYILRSDTAFNGNLTDTLYPAKTNPTIITQAIAQSIDINHGCYIVGITNCANSQYRKGAVTYYALDESDLNSLLQFMFSDTIYTLSNITDIEKGVWKSIQNPMQYITSCVWVPVEANVISSHAKATLDFGYWQSVSGTSGRVIEGTVFGKTNYYQLPSHPQISRGAYLNYAPYARYMLYYPPFGGIEIDPAFRSGGDYVCIHLAVDCTNGMSNLRLSMQATNQDEDKTRRKVIVERSGQAGVPIQLSHVQSDFISGVTGIVNGIVSAVSGNYLGAASGIMGTAAGMTQAKQTSLGYNGSFMATYEYPILVSEFYNIGAENRTEFGRPLCESRTINTLSGYIQCGESDHEFTGTQKENLEINRFLREGFFFE